MPKEMSLCELREYRHTEVALAGLPESTWPSALCSLSTMPDRSCVPAQHAMDAYHASGRSAQAVAEALLEQAQKRRSKDDISVIAVVFGRS